MATRIQLQVVVGGLAFALIGCRAKSKGTAVENTPSTSRTSSQAYIPSFKFKSQEAIHSQADFMAWERRVNQTDTHFSLFAEVGKPESDAPGRIERVKDSDSWPEDTLVSFVVASDLAGITRFIQIIPHSESGDWDESQGFLFDEQGRLRFWTHEFNWFHDGDVISRFKISSAWNSAGQFLESNQAGPKPAEYPISMVPEAITVRALLQKRRLTAEIRAGAANP